MDAHRAIVEINRAARERTTAQFRAAALNILQDRIRFDAASWSSIAAPGRVPQDMQLWGQDSSMIDAYLKVRSSDIVSVRTCKQAGEPQLFNWSSADDQRQFAPRFLSYCQDSGYLNVLSIMVKGSPFSYTSLSLSRENMRWPFDEDERAIMKWIVPHLMHAWVANYALNPAKRINDLEPCDATAIVCSRSGKFLGDGSCFKKMLGEEIPGWDQQYLPVDILETIKRHTIWENHRIKISSKPIADVNIIGIVRKISTPLTIRELEICRRAASGLTHKQIAFELRISPGTVKNHLYHSYAKLGVSNKVSLVRVLGGILSADH